ncbi:MAG: TRAP transporter small permease [Alphaproteobacteria bacterium]|nr:TRAP transporter small permease [Alphaproteobacteria bacterium]
MRQLIARVEFAVAASLLAAIVLLVFVSALMRTLDHPVIWSIDMAQLLFIWLCFFGAVRAMRDKAHLGIDLIVRHLPFRLRFMLEMALSALTLVFLALLSYEGARLALSNIQRQMGDSGLSYFWVTIAVPVGCVMLAIALVFNMVKAVKAHGKDGALVYSRSEAEAAALAGEK